MGEATDLILAVRDKTIEEVRAFMAAEFLNYSTSYPGRCYTCGDSEEAITMEAITEVLDALKKRAPVWEKSNG